MIFNNNYISIRQSKHCIDSNDREYDYYEAGRLILTNQDDFEWKGRTDILDEMIENGYEYYDYNDTFVQLEVSINTSPALDLVDTWYELAEEKDLLDEYPEVNFLLEDLHNLIDNVDIYEICDGTFHEEYFRIVDILRKDFRLYDRIYDKDCRS